MRGKRSGLRQAQAFQGTFLWANARSLRRDDVRVLLRWREISAFGFIEAYRALSPAASNNFLAAAT